MENNIMQSGLANFLAINGGYKMAIRPDDEEQSFPIKQTKAQKAQKEPVQFVPRTGIVQMKGVGRNLQGFTFNERIVWDKEDRIMYGALVGSDNNGKPLFRSINIDNNTVLDLSDPTDRENYYILLHSVFMVGGPRCTTQGRFKAINQEQEAMERNKKRAAVRSAGQIVDDMGGEEMRAFAMVLGISDKNSDVIVKDQLYEQADKNPNELLRRWNSPDRKIWQLVKKAVAEYVLELKDSQYFFGNLAMGINEEMVVEKIKEKPELFEALSDSIKVKTGAVKEEPSAKSPFKKKAD